MSLLVTSRERAPGVYLVILEGRLDAYSSRVCEEQIVPLLAAARDIIFDLTNLAYANSRGLSVIFRIRKELQEKQGLVLLACLQDRVAKIIAMTKVLPAESVFATVAEAEQHLARARAPGCGT